MENSNRNDIQNFFKDMPEHLQKEAINKIKKPPDADSKKRKVRWSKISQLCVK